MPRQYSYDPVGNRTDGGVAIDPGNRLRAFQGFSLTYDADGNLVRKIKSGIADDSLEWNALGELKRVLRSGTVVAEFAYDGFGRRVTKSAAGVITQYQWDDGQVIAERDGSGNFIAEYAFYPGVDNPHSVTTSAGTFAMALETPGNIIGLMPYTANSVSAQYAYKPFGAMERNDQTVTNSLRFQSRPYDPETGLYYFRARYYDPTLARFVSEDPIGLDGGINSYVFAGNDPVNQTDPSGLCQKYTRYADYITENDGVEISRTRVIISEQYSADCYSALAAATGAGPMPRQPRSAYTRACAVAKVELGIAFVTDAVIVSKGVSTTVKALGMAAKFSVAAEAVASTVRLANTNRYAIAIAQRDATYTLAANRLAGLGAAHLTAAASSAQQMPGVVWQDFVPVVNSLNKLDEMNSACAQ